MDFNFFQRGKSLALLFESKVRFARNLERSECIGVCERLDKFLQGKWNFCVLSWKRILFSAHADFFSFFNVQNGRLQTLLASVSWKKLEKFSNFAKGENIWIKKNNRNIPTFRKFWKNLTYTISLIQREIYFKDTYNDSFPIDFYFQSKPSISRLNIHKLKNPQWLLHIINLSISTILSYTDIHVNSMKNRHLIDTGI